MIDDVLVRETLWYRQRFEAVKLTVISGLPNVPPVPVVICRTENGNEKSTAVPEVAQTGSIIFLL